MKPLRALACAVLVTPLLFAGCASTRSAPDAPAMPAAPDYLDETGENGLLTPRAVVGRYVEAIGGEKALRAHTSRTQKGSMSMAAMGIEGDLVLYSKAPDMLALNIELGGMGEMKQGYNGEVGWADNAMTGAQVLDGDMLDTVKVQADYYAPLNYDKHFPTSETVEVVEFNGEPAYKVKLTNAAGKDTTQYFSQESALLLGSEGVQEGPMGETNVVTKLSDYEEFGGIMIPTKTVLDMGGMEIVQQVEAVTFDDVEDSAFALPDSVNKLLE